MACNCPVGRTGTSSQPRKLLGLKSYSVKMDLQETDHLREEALASTTTMLQVGLISLILEPQSETKNFLRLIEVGLAAERGTDNASPVVLLARQDFRDETIWKFVIKHMEEKVYLVWKKEKSFGCLDCLDSTPAQKMDYFLERSQLYPDNPCNALQYKKHWFFIYKIAGRNLYM